jgi:N-acylneuraminate cytidylyltransferase
LKKFGIKSGIITKENSIIIKKRAKKLKVDYVFLGVENKLEKVKILCKKIGISLEEVAYIGDDINCKGLLENVGIAACPVNAVDEIKNIPAIIKLSRKGGEGSFREFVDIIVKDYI